MCVVKGFLWFSSVKSIEWPLNFSLILLKFIVINTDWFFGRTQVQRCSQTQNSDNHKEMIRMGAAVMDLFSGLSLTVPLHVTNSVFSFPMGCRV